ncbi:hypothetical protein ACFQ9V_10425 [Leifsonia sp. NPDC056665]|uniref:hypothetical protein n=1 Tax=Leifsonia sp. NPDC056665 TaxID=3345901 RepID=UPI00369BE307
MIAASAAFVVCAIAILIRSLIGLETLGGALAATLTSVSIVAGAGSIVGLAFALVARKQRGLKEARIELQRRLRRATLYRVYGESDFALSVSVLAKREWHPTMSAFLLLAVHSDRIEFWDADTTAPLVEISAGEVASVECRMATGEGTASRATVFLTVMSDLLDERVDLPFVIMRDEGLKFLPEGMATAERVAHALGAMRDERAR